MDIAERSHWESINTKRKGQGKVERKGLRAWFSRPPARKIINQITDNFFKVDPKKSVFEVGCAPGQRLLGFAARYQYIPYGVEYSKAGVAGVRAEFKELGIPEKNCIDSDVFNKSFQADHKDKFDAVISYGFIEHFTNVDEAIEAHINLLKPGGKLLIMIPNLRGIYCPLTKLLAPDLIPKHNLTIMKMNDFRQLFPREKLEPLFCGYYGVLNFGMLQGRGKIRNLILTGLQLGQTLFNPILRHGHCFENRLTSPYLLFIGKKII